MKAYEKFENRLRELGLYEEWCKQGSCGRIATATDTKVFVLVNEGEGDRYTEFTYPSILEMSKDYDFRRRALEEYKDAGDEEFVRELIQWYLHPNSKCPLFPVDVYLVWDTLNWVDFEDDEEDEYTFAETTEEWCPHCDECVDLEHELKVQKCPHCGKWIVPCSVCPLQDCSTKCPLERMAIILNSK